MPWIKQEACNACEKCLKICSVGAITMKNNKAFIDQDKCIHCGKCLKICPQEAIRHNFENPDLKRH